MGHSFESPEETGAAENQNKNWSSSSPSPSLSPSPSPSPPTAAVVVSGRAKTSRKKSRVTRSQINDFHANANVNEDYEGGGGERRSEKVKTKRSKVANGNGNRNRYHVCKHCNRAFGSGRALGGHIRIHGASFNGGGRAEDSWYDNDDINNNNYNNNNNKSSSKSKSLLKPSEVDGSEESDSDSSASPSNSNSNGCSPKMVSLYTLRNNPKRSSILMDPEFSLDMLGATNRSYWQESNSGIFPPLPLPLPPPCRSSESAGSELKRALLPKWSVTKGRSSRVAAGPRRPKDVGADDRDTANLLVMLAGKTRTNNNKNDGDDESERESTEESVYDSKPPLVSNLESQGSIEDLEAGSGGEESRTVEKKRRKRKKTSKSSEFGGGGGNLVFESDVDAGGIGKYMLQQHQCSTCKKVFNSHQALGGHRASHRKVKGCFAAEGEGEEEEEERGDGEEGEGSFMVEAEGEGEGGTPNTGVHMMMNFEEEGAVTMSHLTQEESPEQESFSQKVGKVQAQAHQCSVCHKVFSSGQALGGHKRCHWIGDRITETATSVISTEKQYQHQQQQESIGGHARTKTVREELLDLNQPPPMDDDDIRAAYDFDVVPACAESVNQRVKMLGGAVANNAVDSFKAEK